MSSGGAGTPEPSTDRDPPATDDELRDEGPPAEGEAEAGSSGAEEGLSPLAPESYEPDPEGPTTAADS